MIKTIYDIELSEEGQKAAERALMWFKERIVELADETLSKVYTDYFCHLEGDAWANYRSQLQRALEGKALPIGATCEEHWAKEVRAKMLKEYPAELHTQLVKDLQEEIARLNRRIDEANSRRF